MNLVKRKDILKALQITSPTLYHLEEIGLPVMRISDKVVRYNLDDVLLWAKGFERTKNGG